MPSGDSETGKSDLQGPKSSAGPWWKVGGTVGAIAGTVANGIQIATTGKPSVAGLVVFGAILVAATVSAAYRKGRAQQDGERRKLAGELGRRLDEIAKGRTVVDSTLAAYHPYRDERIVVFDVGDRPGGDAVEDNHTTTPVHGPVVYWCQFEAFNRGNGHPLTWDDIKLDVARPPDRDGDPLQAHILELQNEPAPRALITFAPPRGRVTWTARYRSPGYWDPLRREGQLFEWSPPPVGLDEDGGRRTPVLKVTFVFRVPVALGILDVQVENLPFGVTYRADPNGTERVRKYRFTVDDVTALHGSTASSIDPISWYLRLRPGGAT